MAKKKSKKKESKKKEIKKEIKLKLKKKKDSKKKDSKKKDSKKKDSKKKDSKKKESKKKASKKKKGKKQEPIPLQSKVVGNIEKSAPAKPVPSKAPVSTKEDLSSNYKATEAIKKLRTLKSREDVLFFIRNEKRVTVTRVIPGVLNRLKK